MKKLYIGMVVVWIALIALPFIAYQNNFSIAWWMLYSVIIPILVWISWSILKDEKKEKKLKEEKW